MGSEIAFFPDGTGWLDDYSALFGTRRTAFRWRLVAPGQLEILTDPETAHPDERWDRFRFSAGWFETDDGTLPVLHNGPGQPGYQMSGFHTLPAPITSLPQPSGDVP